MGLLAIFVTVSATAGQQVRLAEAPRTDAQRALEAFLDRGDYLLWTRDTVLAIGDTVPRSLLLLEGTARVAGRIEGDVYVVDGDLFLRSRGSIAGDVVVLGGGFYDSDVAVVEGAITYRPNERVRVRPTEGAFEVISEVAPLPVLEWDGTRGFHEPTYQRVDALTFGFGGLVRVPNAPGHPELEAALRYKTGPAQLDGAIRASWYASRRLRLGVAASRATRSNDDWIRSTWYNSLAHFVAGDDDRAYYRADRVGLELELVSPEPPIWEDAPTWTLTLALGREEARSLAARDVVTLFGDDLIEPMPPATDPTPPYPNPAIDDGEIYSARAGFEWTLRTRQGRVGFGLGFEAGTAGDDVGNGDLDVFLVEARASARRATAWGHVWDVFAIGRADVAGVLPMQRWSSLGGVGALPTLPGRALRGPRLLYVDATYAVPLLGVPALGGLDAFARVSAGGAGGADEAFRVEESAGAGLAARLWDFQMELGLAVGSTVGPDGAELVPFFDVRWRRSTRPSQSPRRGRGF
ncbi:MAG: polymer-forming cytoskeletal protein [Gemmatimonadetes bacterium]|nr:polymer-forming cytoskeletal protein [Gemmatimonadota bacterium]